MARSDTALNSAAAEHLVLGHLLMAGVSAYKAYGNQPGFDLIAANPAEGKAARIQVKSRFPTGAGGFPLKVADGFDFLVFVRLNRGTRRRPEPSPPIFYVFPSDVIQAAHRPGRFSKVVLRDIPNNDDYRDRWDLITTFLVFPDS